MKGVLGIKRVYILVDVPFVMLVDGDLHFENPGETPQSCCCCCYFSLDLPFVLASLLQYFYLRL